jgi:cbb3-type cytochrome oxidase maturation protein
MDVMLWLILSSFTVAGGGLAIFMWSLRAGQYEDLKGASSRILFDG